MDCNISRFLLFAFILHCSLLCKRIFLRTFQSYLFKGFCSFCVNLTSFIHPLVNFLKDFCSHFAKIFADIIFSDKTVINKTLVEVTLLNYFLFYDLFSKTFNPVCLKDLKVLGLTLMFYRFCCQSI